MELSKQIEALLFVADRPISAQELADLVGEVEPEEVSLTIGELNNKYDSEGRAFFIRKIAGGYQFATRRDYFPLIKKLYNQEKTVNLSEPALEVLAIIAYYQPVTRSKIDRIRGVSSQSHIKNLLEVRLIKIQGRLKAPGRPIIYGTTERFLKFFGLNSIEDLPNFYQIKEITKTGVTSNNSDLN
jgi:segregation and condensation protein B